VRYRHWMPWVGSFLLVTGVALMLIGGLRLGSRWQAALLATPTPELLIPTRTPGAGSPLPTPPAGSQPGLVSPLPTPGTPAWTVPPAERSRLCVSLPDMGGEPLAKHLAPLGVGWTLDWQAQSSLDLPAGVEYVRMARMKGGELAPDARALKSLAAANPGGVWLISNEPDVRGQDNVAPKVYAQLYREAYTAIKAGDPTAIVAAGGVAQTTPLRLRYLDAVLDAYIELYEKSLPADAWQIHAYILREERDSWGVDIPPGLPDDVGELYAIEDSGNLDILRANVAAFREWQARRGYGSLPLYVTEFGIPMPADYGFPPERVSAFMVGAWQYFLTATDPALGDPNDGGRLVQRWCWFSMAYPPYPTGDLVDQTGRWTQLGQTWLAYVGNFGGGESGVRP